MLIKVTYFVLCFLLDGEILPTIHDFSHIEDCRAYKEKHYEDAKVKMACVVHYDYIVIDKSKSIRGEIKE